MSRDKYVDEWLCREKALREFLEQIDAVRTKLFRWEWDQEDPPSWFTVFREKVRKEHDRVLAHRHRLSLYDEQITLSRHSDLSSRARQAIDLFLGDNEQATITVDDLICARQSQVAVGEKTFNEIAAACGSNVRLKNYRPYDITDK